MHAVVGLIEIETLLREPASGILPDDATLTDCLARLAGHDMPRPGRTVRVARTPDLVIPADLGNLAAELEALKARLMTRIAASRAGSA